MAKATKKKVTGKRTAKKKVARKKPTSKITAANADRHELYEQSVQCPEADVRFLTRVFRKLRGRVPLTLREDFGGTSLLCAEWVKSRRDREAWSVDLDTEVLEWGRRRNIEPLGPKADRVHLIEGNVLTPRKPLVDVQVGFNFSYCIFHDRPTLLKYFTAARKSLKEDGLYLIDIHGGPEAFDALSEDKKFPDFKYVWEQGDFSPITHHRVSRIHFHFPDGTRIEDAFVYDWRVWTCPELRDLMAEAGFKKTLVYWEGTDSEGEGNGIYTETQEGENDPSWIAYIVAIK